MDWPQRYRGHRYGTIPYYAAIVATGKSGALRYAAAQERDRLYLASHRLYDISTAGALRRTIERRRRVVMVRGALSNHQQGAATRKIPGMRDDQDELDQAYSASAWLWLTGGRALLPSDDALRNEIILPAWTQDEAAEEGEETKAWPDFDYLAVLLELYRNFPKTAVWKSRRMLATWGTIADFTHAAQYGRGREYIFQCKTEEDSYHRLLKKAWFLWDHQPDWLKARHPARLVGNRMEFLGAEVIITAIQQGDRGFRGPTVSGIYIDEIAHMDGVEDILAAANAAAVASKKSMPIRLVSTPNGREKFYRVTHDIGGRPLTVEEQETRGAFKARDGCGHKGMTWRLNSNGYLAVFLHYSADPEKDPCNPTGQAWYERAHQPYLGDEGRWNREFELSADIAAGTPVYAEAWTDALNVSDTIVYQRGKIPVGGWDFGFHHPAFVAGYVNDAGQLLILEEALGSRRLIQEFGEEMKRTLRARMVGAPAWRDFGDPAGAQRSDKSQRSSIEVLAGLGIYVSYRHFGIQDGLVTIRALLRRREDGRPGLIVHARCRNLIDAMRGGYHYPETKSDEPDRESEVPYKDGFYEHLCDALRYLATGIARPGGRVVAASNPQPPRKQRRLNPRTGY